MDKVWLDINNRDVKFRVFDRPGQKMYYPSDNIELIFTIRDGKHQFDVVEHQYIPNVNDNKGIKFSMTDTLNGHLMQYTGYKDSNDIEIYENDILVKQMLGKDIYYEVVFKEGSWKVRTKTGDNNYSWNHLATIRIASKIIGNIYQNPNII